MSFSVRTDLAIEAREILRPSETADEIEGVEVTVEENEHIKTTWVRILDENGAKKLSKRVGNYITIESEKLKENETTTHEEIIMILAEKLGKLFHFKKDSVILVVGLGNWNVTPDALGPKVISKILVTSHMKDIMPEELKGKVRAVSAISPGVMGLTGIETVEIIKGVAERLKPDVVIAIDALAARKSNRINTTIQISDTGINPGAGIGNRRASLNSDFLGIPVLAIGVPTVVDAATLVNDTMDMMLSSMIAEAPEGTQFYQMLVNLENDDKYKLISEILNPYVGTMFVTPKEVDAVIGRLSNVIANSLNLALHPGIDQDDINRYLC